MRKLWERERARGANESDAWAPAWGCRRASAAGAEQGGRAHAPMPRRPVRARRRPRASVGPEGERDRKAALSAGLPGGAKQQQQGGVAGRARKAPSGVPPPRDRQARREAPRRPSPQPRSRDIVVEDASAQASMKSAASCETSCDTQDFVNHRILERLTPAAGGGGGCAGGQPLAWRRRPGLGHR